MIRRPPRSTRTDTLVPTRRSSDLLAQSGGLGGIENGWLGRRLMAQDLVDEVEFGPGQPFGARHVAPAEDFRIGLVCHDLELIPDRRPEGLDIDDRPAPQRVGNGDVEAQTAGTTVPKQPPTT